MFYWVGKITEASAVFIVFFFWWAFSYSLLRVLIDSCIDRLVDLYAPDEQAKVDDPFWRRVFRFHKLYPLSIGVATFLFYLYHFSR